METSEEKEDEVAEHSADDSVTSKKSRYNLRPIYLQTKRSRDFIYMSEHFKLISITFFKSKINIPYFLAGKKKTPDTDAADKENHDERPVSQINFFEDLQLTLILSQFLG